jgi:hypothetical protein
MRRQRKTVENGESHSAPPGENASTLRSPVAEGAAATRRGMTRTEWDAMWKAFRIVTAAAQSGLEPKEV